MPIVSGLLAAQYHDNHIINSGFKGSDGRNIRLNYHRWPMIDMPESVCGRRARHIVSSLGLTATDVVAVIGAGFGFLAEALLTEVPGMVVAATDNGGYIQSAHTSLETTELSIKVVNAGWGVGSPEHTAIMAEIDTGLPRAQVVIEDNPIVNQGQRNQLVSTYGDFSWAISEQVGPWLEDAEMVDLDADMQSLAINVAHLTTPFLPKFLGQVEPLLVWNWKYLSGDESQPINQEILDQPWYTTRSWKTLLPDATILGPQGGIA